MFQAWGEGLKVLSPGFTGQALVFVPELSQLCGRLPAWATPLGGKLVRLMPGSSW